MKKLITLTLLTLVMAFMPISGLYSQESNKVLLFIPDGSPDLEFMLKEEVGVTSKPIAAQLGSVKNLAEAGLLKGKTYASAFEFDNPYFEGSVRTGTGVVKDGNIITSGICPLKARRDKVEDGSEELANALVMAINTGTN
jgi:hypothetical protein